MKGTVTKRLTTYYFRHIIFHNSFLFENKFPKLSSIFISLEVEKLFTMILWFFWLHGWLRILLVNLQHRSRTTFQWEYSGIFWNIMEYSKILQDIMEYSRSLLFHFILKCSRIFQNVTKYSKVLKNIKKYSKIFENIWEYSRIFWIIGKLFPSGTSCIY